MSIGIGDVPISEQPTVRLASYAQARDAMRNRNLRQGLYDEGKALMEKVIVNLHANEHTTRRRLENRLFRRETFVHWEKNLIPDSVMMSIAPYVGGGSIDMVELARTTMMRIAADIAGIDLGDDPARFPRLAGLMARMARAANVNHFIGDKREVIDDGNDALATYKREFFDPACSVRSEAVRRRDAGEIGDDDLPKDVLTTLLANQRP